MLLEAVSELPAWLLAPDLTDLSHDAVTRHSQYHSDEKTPRKQARSLGTVEGEKDELRRSHGSVEHLGRLTQELHDPFFMEEDSLSDREYEP